MSFNYLDEIVVKSPLLDPYLLQQQSAVPAAYDFLSLENETLSFEEEITEKETKKISVENIIELLMAGATTGFSFSTDAKKQPAEVGLLKKILFPKLMMSINKPSLKATYTNLVKKQTTASFITQKEVIDLVEKAFSFKDKAVKLAKTEYQTWRDTKVDGIYSIKEYDGTAPFNLIEKYWKSLSSPPSPIKVKTPWSAVFISWLMKESGADDLFEYSSAHIDYIQAALKNRRGNAINPFYLYNIEEFIKRMQPGDLLCKGRTDCGITKLKFSNVLNPPEKTAHVDIITAIDIPNKTIRTIGGNVSDNVDHKKLTIAGKEILNSDGDPYFGGIAIGNA